MGRKKALFVKNASDPFPLSRVKLEGFINCPRCFYLDRKLGIPPPSTIPFNLNNAVDNLMKKDFQTHRIAGTVPPIVKAAGLHAIPFNDPIFEPWTDYHKGLRYLLSDINVSFYGALDDVWVEDDKMIVVDYKATSSDHAISLDDPWKIAYKHQVEMYQWLLKQNGYQVSDSAYFVYTNALKSADKFEDILTFETKLIEYKGNTDWVEPMIRKAYLCLCSDVIPEASTTCELCKYAAKVKEL